MVHRGDGVFRLGEVVGAEKLPGDLRRGEMLPQAEAAAGEQLLQRRPGPAPEHRLAGSIGQLDLGLGPVTPMTGMAELIGTVEDQNAAGSQNGGEGTKEGVESGGGKIVRHPQKAAEAHPVGVEAGVCQQCLTPLGLGEVGGDTVDIAGNGDPGPDQPGLLVCR